jgi:DNA-binding NarL/FixJ family response regulator
MSFQTKILIIEKDPLSIRKIQKDLTSEGYNACCVNNGASGIKKAFEYNPDLIVCSREMETIGGFQIYEILKQSSLTDRIPFIFVSNSSDLSDLRKAMNLGVDDYLIKPFDTKDLIRSIEKRLSKYKILKETGKREYKKLSDLSPNGIFIFDDHLIEANLAFLAMFKIKKEDITTFTLEEFLEPHSLQRVNEKISQCIHGIADSFYEEVIFTLVSGESFEGTLYVCIIEKYTGYALKAGLVILNNSKRNHSEATALDIQKILVSEKVNIPESLEQKLADVFKKNNNHFKNQLTTPFSEREKEVLCLSMEGHPTKIIADKLSISDRTVEKHRARLMEKTNSNNMIEVIVYSLRNNLINI